MNDGYYKLNKDVANPKPDGRSKRRLDCAALWPAGTVVFVKNEAQRAFEAAQKAAGERLPPEAMPGPLGHIRFKDGTQVRFDTNDGDPRFVEDRQGNGILSNLEPAHKTLGQVLRQADWRARDLLAFLIDMGKITLADVDAIKHHDLTPDIDHDNFEARDQAVKEFEERHEINHA